MIRPWALTLLLASAAAHAAPAGTPIGSPAENGALPLITLERIDVVGQTWTDARRIVRALGLREGDTLHADSPRLRQARYRLLALGYFRDVTLELIRGSARGQVILRVRVDERGTLVLNRLSFGASTTSRGWGGLDVGDRNFLGSGLTVEAGGLYAHPGDITGGRAQAAGEVRISLPAFADSPWGSFLAMRGIRGSEPYRVSGELDDDDRTNFAAFDYHRLGLRAGATYALASTTRMGVSLRIENLRAALPDGAVRTHPTGVVTPIDFHLRDGRSTVNSLGLSFELDRRDDPILPHRGHRLDAALDASGAFLGSDYEFASLLLHAEHYWPVQDGDHAIAVKLDAGLVLGDPPWHDRLPLAAFNRMLTPSAAGVTLAASPPPDLLGTRDEAELRTQAGAGVMVEYVARWFRGDGRIYGGDLFIGAGLWGARGTGDDPRAEGGWRDLPIDLQLDAGVRIDTEIGVFEFTFANALGRVPL